MRDANRIPGLCVLLQRAWERSPDLRLGQLVVAAVRPSSPCPELFYAEDSRVRRGLERLAEHGAPPLAEPPDAEAVLDWKTLGEPAPTTVVFHGARLASFCAGSLFCQVLELRFGGEYRHGSEGEPDAEAMALRLASLLWRAEPDVVLLDLSALRYAWGNGIVRVFEVIDRFDVDYPLGAVVLGGPASAPGLATLGLLVHTDPAAAIAAAKTRAVRRSADIG